MIAVADTREHRLQSGRSRILASSRPCHHGFQLRRGRRSRILSGSRQEGQRAHDETERGSVGKGLKKDGRAAEGERDSYRRLKAARARTFPEAEAAILGGGKPAY
jgi:hypothetical protein